MRTLSRLTLTITTLATFLLGLTSVADAREFRMSGNWIQQFTPNVQIPILGGIDAANTVASANGSGPASFTVPVNAFRGMDAFLFAIPASSVVQLSTMFSFAGPGATGNFFGGAKGTRPANFAFCPGPAGTGAQAGFNQGAPANPGCTTPQTGGTQGTQHGQVIYTAGPNQFGGTMRMLILGSGSLSRIVGTSPVRIQHNLLGGSGFQAEGGVYANSVSTVIAAGVVTTGAVCQGGPCGTNGVIITPGVVDGSGTASTNNPIGFPFTTGMVTVNVTDDVPMTYSTLTVTGADLRTPLGSGNVTMVAGGLAFLSPSDGTASRTRTVTMTFRPRNLPSMGPAGMAALAGLFIVGGGYAARRRFGDR
jgi:hypothetical protein